MEVESLFAEIAARVETIEPGYARPGTEMEAAVRMLVSLFERETPVELSFDQVGKL